MVSYYQAKVFYAWHIKLKAIIRAKGQEMSRLDITIPEGTRDRLFAEADIYQRLVERFTGIYEKSGFLRVETPTIENYDLIATVNSSIKQENMYKLTDNTGKLMALRPDNTTPIARVAATKLKNAGLPQKLFYNQNIYRINGDYSGKRNEIFQSGIELIGAPGLKGDILCITTALEILKSLGLNYKLEIGHAGFFNSIVSSCGLTDDEDAELRKFVEAKRYVRFQGQQKSKFGEKIMKLPQLFGGEEIFDEAAEVAEGIPEAVSALEYVKKLYGLFVNAGYRDQIMIDLDIVPKFNYYTGVLFRGYIDKAGEPVLKGGRYDKLLSTFGFDVPATGFAINVCAAADALEKTGMMLDSKAPDVIVHFDENSFPDAAKRKKWYNEQGLICELSTFENINETYKYAKHMNIKKVENLTSDTEVSG